MRTAIERSGIVPAPSGKLPAGFPSRAFVPVSGLSNGHAQTILGNLRRRSFKVSRLRAQRREFSPEAGVHIVTFCHWQPDPQNHPTVVIVHGLEGSAEAGYVCGTADKALAWGFNVVRCNVRNCGGTEHLTPTLYHSGLTLDLRHIISELIIEDGLKDIFVVGFSMGGNQALKMAGEDGSNAPPQLRGVCAVSPPVDLALCSRSIGLPQNRIYEYRFLRSLKAKMQLKKRLFPDIYDLKALQAVRSLWEFDDVMAPYNGFRDARDYYAKASSLQYLPEIRVPTLVIHAEDDPFIPIEPFRNPVFGENEWLHLLATEHGGHVAFCGRRQPDEDRAWAENRCIEFCRRLLTENRD